MTPPLDLAALAREWLIEQFGMGIVDVRMMTDELVPLLAQSHAAGRAEGLELGLKNAATPIVITGGAILPDGRKEASFVWPFDTLTIPNGGYGLIALTHPPSEGERR